MENKVCLDFLKRLAKGIAAQFGRNCEVVVHDVTAENTILAIENGHVTNRHVGDGPSHVVLDALKKHGQLEDKIAYLTRTQDGRVLKSTTIYVRDEREAVIGILSINYDISELLVAEKAIGSLIGHEESKDDEETKNAPRIPQSVNDLLVELIEESVQVAGGKPPAMMTKEEKTKAIQFLSDAGAFLITKSGDQVSNYFGISKYTMYSYIDANKKED